MDPNTNPIDIEMNTRINMILSCGLVFRQRGYRPDYKFPERLLQYVDYHIGTHKMLPYYQEVQNKMQALRTEIIAREETLGRPVPFILSYAGWI